ncbi:Myo-inositol 2-dehydrogenase [Pseudocercospora fuligena]|uniref:Myo-inositol 2-dehydrogenase n=1 Tax=Pseudocercospora fuligena TaxID=685502 RepID=A0A8H6VFM4_9PEZI|nr:Myo-inositol 2-dehydrogenase [Pseudocercospora fuligena]
MEGQGPIKIAIIGTGLIGPRHANSVSASPIAVLHCFVDPRAEAAAIAETFAVPWYESVHAMLQAEHHPEAAIVCTPNHTHVAVATELLRAGIHVLVEKPLATSIEDARNLIETAKCSQRHLIAGHHRRFNPYVTAAKRALEQGTIGRPIAVSGIWATYKPDSYFAPPTEWRAGVTGGPILINLVHDLDVLQYLLGPITRVHAEKALSTRGNQAEEGAAILLRFASGVVGTFILSDASPSAHNFESGTGENPTIPRMGKDFYRIFGSEGTLSVGDMKVSSYDDAVEKSWTSLLGERVLDVGQQVPFDEQVANLIAVVRGLEQPRCTGADGLSALVLCDAVQQAMASGQPVDVGEIM